MANSFLSSKILAVANAKDQLLRSHHKRWVNKIPKKKRKEKKNEKEETY